jgi:ubiquinone/menaquinone biosynthesis C-methylase UbiE
MDPLLYQRVFRFQKTHWWYLSRMKFLDVLLRGVPRKGRVLDVGCGPGSMLHYLGTYGEVVGVDRYLPALEMARTHFSGVLVAGDTCHLPFQDGRFSLVAACEVLYHQNVGDVRRAIDELVRVLEPGGYLVVVDSAYSACFSSHDRAAHGARRFTRPVLTALFQEAGLEVLHATYAYSLLLPVVWMVRRWKELWKIAEQPGEELHETWGPLNALMVGWFSLEAQLAGRLGLPFGLSVQLLGHKPKT